MLGAWFDDWLELLVVVPALEDILLGDEGLFVEELLLLGVFPDGALPSDVPSMTESLSVEVVSYVEELMFSSVSVVEIDSPVVESFDKSDELSTSFWDVQPENRMAKISNKGIIFFIAFYTLFA